MPHLPVLLGLLQATRPALADAVPAWARAWLLPLGLALAGLLALWLLFAILGARRRRAYNLTRMETARAKEPPSPSFLKVDHEARAEAIRRGDAYVRPADQPPPAPPQGPPLSLFGLLCRVGAGLAALAHITIAAVTFLSVTHDADQVMQQISATDRLQAVLSRYWLGFALAVVLIAAELARFILSRRRRA